MRNCRSTFGSFVGNEADLSSLGSVPDSASYNPDGLLIETFARFGPRVWRAVEAELGEVKR